MKLVYSQEDNWPPLAWLATCIKNKPQVLIRHGTGLEIRPRWFCEAVWTDSFDAGDFDRSSYVFGSGGRRRGNQLVFVSSSSICDRLHHVRLGDATFVSNSLACLVATSELRLDPWYPWYYEDITSVVDGINHYKRCVETDKGEVALTYYRNLVWDGTRIRTVDKPLKTGPFSSFRDYREFLEIQLGSLFQNMRSVERRQPVGSISTSSAGYDSLTASILTAGVGNREVICVPTGRGDRPDSAVGLIRQLGLSVLEFERQAWRSTPFADVSFVAADACGRDSWLFPGIDSLHRRVLFTGCFGGHIWSCRGKPEAPVFERLPPRPLGITGISLGEFRLQAGFQHCPVPFIGAEQGPSIQAISRSREMRQWRLGYWYDRPIPRRIIEEAGIRRKAFARRKTAVAVHYFRNKEFRDLFAGSDSFRDYLLWIYRRHRELAPRPIDSYPLTTPSREPVEVPLFRHIFPWAIERHARVFRNLGA